MSEVQRHGIIWEKNIIYSVYGVNEEELKQVKYTNKFDLPCELNRLENVNISIKTTSSANSICMADCLRVYDSVGSSDDPPLHMTVIQYTQDDATNTKKLVHIIEVNLTNSKELLFGSVTRADIETLDKMVKSVPQKRKPTIEEYEKMYLIRDRLQMNSGAIRFDIKCNSTQSRLQCSFNRFQKFIKENPDRIIAQSNNSDFRGGKIINEIQSTRRRFNDRV